MKIPHVSEPCMKNSSKLLIALFISFSLLITGCARQPSEKRTTNIIKGYFKKYSKKYPDTIYGQSPLETVEITKKQEIHKNLVAVQAFITLKDGTVKRIHVTVEKSPLGWRFISWENAS